MNLLNSNGNEHMKALSFVTYESKYDSAVLSVEVFIDLVFLLVMNLLVAS